MTQAGKELIEKHVKRLMNLRGVDLKTIISHVLHDGDYLHFLIGSVSIQRGADISSFYSELSAKYPIMTIHCIDY